MDMQALINAVSKSMREERSKYHMTLGDLIEALKSAGDGPVMVDSGGSAGEPRSYRGHYSDLALSPIEENTVAGLLAEIEPVLNTELTGYKGGGFMMYKDVPLWVSGYGAASSIAVIGSSPLPGGGLMLVTKLIDD